MGRWKIQVDVTIVPHVPRAEKRRFKLQHALRVRKEHYAYEKLGAHLREIEGVKGDCDGIRHFLGKNPLDHGFPSSRGAYNQNMTHNRHVCLMTPQKTMTKRTSGRALGTRSLEVHFERPNHFKNGWTTLAALLHRKVLIARMVLFPLHFFSCAR